MARDIAPASAPERSEPVRSIILLSLACLAASAADASYTLPFSDGDFPESLWSQDVLLSGDASLDSVTTQPSGGNPGAHREFAFHVGPGVTDACSSIQIYAFGVYDPAAVGPLYSLQLDLDFVSWNGAPTRVGIVVEQGGVYYAHVLADAATHTDWQHYSFLASSEADFPRLEYWLGGNPDFSESGAPIRFGVAVGQFGLNGGGSPDFLASVDNWSVLANPFGPSLSVSDGEFDPLDWTQELVVSGTGSLVSDTTAVSGGNPGAYREADFLLGTELLDAFALVELTPLATWDPDLRGPIRSISASLDFASPGATPARVGFVVHQDGHSYAHVFATGASHTDWQGYSHYGIDAADFPRLEYWVSGTPDFSDTASTMTFGFAVGQFGVFAGGATDFLTGVDNWSVEVNGVTPDLPLADGEFVPADWVEDVLAAGNANLVSSTTEPAGGDPGAYRRSEFFVGTTITDALSHVQTFDLGTYDPAERGPVYAIRGGMDFASFNGAPTRVGLVIEQDGIYYAHVFATGATNTDWRAFDALLTSPDQFTRLEPFTSGNPDFSATASPMRFGFAVGQFGFASGGVTDFQTGIDDWFVQVNPPLSTAVPGEPPALRIPAGLHLANHPNPFRPATTLSFFLPEASVVDLAIYDVAGRCVANLHRAERLEPGPHEIRWNGRSRTGRAVTAGVYFARLQTGEDAATRRLLLLR
jgi:hypothetical protein